LVAELVSRDLNAQRRADPQEIIRKAAPIFNQRGYDGAALSDLMKATGLEKGGIYRHFSSKEALAAEAFDYAWRETLDARIHDLDTIPNTVDRLSSWLRILLNGAESFPVGAHCSTRPSIPMTEILFCASAHGRPCAVGGATLFQ